MTEKEIYVNTWYREYGSMILDTKTAPKLWGSSKSTVDKLFSDPDPKDTETTREERMKSLEKQILKQKIIPKWIMVGCSRKWKLVDIADWLIGTELKTA